MVLAMDDNKTMTKAGGGRQCSNQSWAVAGDKTIWGQQSMIGGKSVRRQERWRLHDGLQWQKQMAAADNNATTNQRREQQKLVGSWCQDHLREVVDDWHQKWPATRVSMVAWWHAMTKADSGQWCSNQTMMGAAKGGQWLVTRLPEGSSQWLSTVCDDKSRWQTTAQQPTNNGSSKGQIGAGEETAWGQWLKNGWFVDYPHKSQKLIYKIKLLQTVPIIASISCFIIAVIRLFYQTVVFIFLSNNKIL
jgi:hypothetical protein